MKAEENIYVSFLQSLRGAGLTSVLNFDGNLYLVFDNLVLYLLFDATFYPGEHTLHRGREEITKDQYTVQVTMHLGQSSKPLTDETNGKIEINSVVDGIQYPPFSGSGGGFYNEKDLEIFELKLEPPKTKSPKLLGKTLFGIEDYQNGIKLEFESEFFIFIVPANKNGCGEIYSGEENEIRQKDEFALELKQY